MNLDRLKQAIIIAEKFEPMAYEDCGQLSGGYGHKLPVGWNPAEIITRDQADVWLNMDVDMAVRDTLSVFPRLRDFTEARQEGLVEMLYNLGLTRFRKFKKMIAAVRVQDWPTAAIEATDSMWYRQVGRRAMRIVHQIESGEFE